MARRASYAEQWDDQFTADARRCRVESDRWRPARGSCVRGATEFDPCLVLWACVQCPCPPRGRHQLPTVWLAFQESPHLHAERVSPARGSSELGDSSAGGPPSLVSSTLRLMQ
jgi:hypothetical protein